MSVSYGTTASVDYGGSVEVHGAPSYGGQITQQYYVEQKGFPLQKDNS